MERQLSGEVMVVVAAVIIAAAADIIRVAISGSVLGWDMALATHGGILMAVMVHGALILDIIMVTGRCLPGWLCK